MTDQQRIYIQDAVRHAIRSMHLRMRNMETNIPYIVGSPGIGKTKIIKYLIDSEVVDSGDSNYKIGSVFYTPALQRLEQFGGIPNFKTVVDDNGEEELHTVWSIPELVVRIKELSKKYYFLFVIFDDWHLCPTEIQQIGFELFTHYSLNGYSIPRNVGFILAGNETSAAGARVALSAIKDRSYMLYTQPDVKYWINNFAIPKKIHASGIDFFENDCNYQFFNEPESTIEKFATPRSWATLFNHITVMENSSTSSIINTEDLVIMAKGCVGTRSGMAFVEHYNAYSSIKIDGDLNTGTCNFPTNNIQQYIYARMLSNKVYSLLATCVFSKKKNPELTNLIKNICKNFVSILNYLKKNHEEHFIVAIHKFVNIKENKKDSRYQLESGYNVLVKLIQEKYISEDFIDIIADAYSKIDM